MKITQSQIRKIIQEEIAKVNETAHRGPNALDLALKERGLDYGRWASPAAWNDPESGKTDYRNKPFVMSSEDPENYRTVLAQVEDGEMTAAAGADKLIQIVLDRSAEVPLNEVDNTQPEKMLGDIHVRVASLLKRLRSVQNAAQDPELKDFLNDLRGELRMYEMSTMKYKDLGEIR